VNQKVLSVIQSIDSLHAKDLDECSVYELTQLWFSLQKHLGSIFVKTVGRMACACDARPYLNKDCTASPRWNTDGDVT